MSRPEQRTNDLGRAWAVSGRVLSVAGSRGVSLRVAFLPPWTALVSRARRAGWRRGWERVEKV